MSGSSRNIELGKIHMGAQQLGMDTHDKDPDSTYRQMLWTIGRVTSAADLDAKGRTEVLEHLKAKGARFSAGSGPKGRKPPARVRLIYHIWNRLSDAGSVNHRHGLGAWLQANTRRFHPQGTGWLKPEFVPDDLKNQLIEQLKQWAARDGVKWQ